MRKNVLLSAALGIALLVGGSGVAAAQNSAASQGKTSQAEMGNDQGMMLVLPGVKQTITGGDRQQVQIAKEVRHELAMLPYYSIWDILKYRVDGTTVTLSGSTISLGLKRDAENAAKSVEGVTKVVNNIDELPPFGSDQQLRLAVARRIFSWGGLSKYSWESAPTIHIIVKGGHVSLEGVVDSQADKDAAGMQARQVPGVIGDVQNNLLVATK